MSGQLAGVGNIQGRVPALHRDCGAGHLAPGLLDQLHEVQTDSKSTLPVAGHPVGYQANRPLHARGQGDGPFQRSHLFFEAVIPLEETTGEVYGTSQVCLSGGSPGKGPLEVGETPPSSHGQETQETLPFRFPDFYNNPFDDGCDPRSYQL